MVMIHDWNPKNKRMFDGDYYYDKTHEDYEESYGEMVEKCKPNEVILKGNTEYTLVISYPLSTPYKKKFKTGKKGKTRIQLVDMICKSYRKIYFEEDSSTEIPPLLGSEGGNAPMFNRQETDGKYGIWGHCIEDLLLHSVSITPKGTISCGVDS